MHICLVYDLLYPYTIGGAERWYRNLGEGLAAQGHRVTYLTLRHWPESEIPEVPGVEVVPVGPRFELYTSSGRRRIAPPLRFGLGVLRHLTRAARAMTSCTLPRFPTFRCSQPQWPGAGTVFESSSIGSRSGRPSTGADTWDRSGGASGSPCKAAASGCDSRLSASRSCSHDGCRSRAYGDVRCSAAIYAGPAGSPPEPAEPVVVFAGRHIPEKQAPALVPAIASARARVPELRGEIFGDGPARPEVLRLIAEHGLDGAVDAPGFVAEDRLRSSLRRALCLALPSRREGYGLVVVEAAALGVPSVVVRYPDNAATELVEEGENGAVADSAEPAELAAAILRVHAAGPALRESTAAWYDRNADRLSLERSLETVLAAYSRSPA